MQQVSHARDNFGISGVLTARVVVPREEAHRAVLKGVNRTARPFVATRRGTKHLPNFDDAGLFDRIRHRRHIRGITDIEDPVVLYGAWHNGFVNLGLHYILDRIFNLNTPNASVSHMGISDDTTAVTASTLLLDPTPSGDSPLIRSLGTGVGASATSRTAETVTATAGFEPSDFPTAVFAITKVGLLNTSTDAGDDTPPTVEGILNIIGGTGGASPYDEEFELNLVNVTDFDLTLALDITAEAT